MCIGCFYFTLGNLHPKYRSTLKSIHLLALIKNEHLKKYGVDSVLQHITNDVAKLEEVRMGIWAVLALGYSLIIIYILYNNRVCLLTPVKERRNFLEA